MKLCPNLKSSTNMLKNFKKKQWKNLCGWEKAWRMKCLSDLST